MNHSRSALRLNVSFIVHLTVGSSREFLFDFPHIHLPPDLDLKKLSGTAQVTRTPQNLLVQIKMRATLLVECARCLVEFEQPLKIDFTELYAFSPRSVSESGLILPDNGEIDLAPLVREYMLLEIPINTLCTSDCKGFCPICGDNLTEKQHNHRKDSIDPRLAVLKKLLENE